MQRYYTVKITGVDMLIEGSATFLTEVGLPWHIPRTVSTGTREQSRKNLSPRDTAKATACTCKSCREAFIQNCSVAKSNLPA